LKGFLTEWPKNIFGSITFDLMSGKKKVLVAPLNWGLGHATRCIPIIRELISQGVEVILAAEEHPKALLQREYPKLEFIDLSGYDVTYPSSGNMAVHMIKLMPRILNGVKKEGEQLNKAIDDFGIDGVISDNRFGLYSNRVPTVFITHQVMIKSPYAESILQKLNRRFIRKFDHCWIPDFEGTENLSGDLSHKYKLTESARFIGPLSRFSKDEKEPDAYKYDVIAVISGPEPQRTLFQHIVTTELEINNIKALMVLGKASIHQDVQQEKITMKSHLKADELQDAINKSRIVVARSGYSTIMDLATLGKSAILIPTPGQTEQEYLAQYHYERGHYFTVEQDRFDLDEALDQMDRFKGIKSDTNATLLKQAVTEFIQTL